MTKRRNADGKPGRFRGVLLDLGGVVFVGDSPLPGALEALERLRGSGLPLRFLTNTTRRSTARLVADLRKICIGLSAEEVLTPAQVARDYLAAEGLAPHLLIHPNLAEDFEGLPPGDGAAVVVGDAGKGFTYEALNAAFRRLEGGAALLALAGNRKFRDADGEMSLDTGAFVRALEYASGREAVMLGKPAPAFFLRAVAALGCTPGEAVMVGDDAEADVGGAMTAGLAGVLVKTGKYHPGDEDGVDPTHVAEDLGAAVEWILARA